jgi:hydroxymethylpyrimidine pyrophosphatase-like HAD family hydrolase
MSIIKSIKTNHFDLKEKRNWEKTYWFFDIHGTILKSNYSYGNTPKEFYPYAKETLQFLSKLSDIDMAIYTCSHPHEIQEYVNLFNENGIKFKFINENPEVATQNNGYGCYDKKPYFNVLFEDKAGFDADTEWKEVLEFMKSKYEQI